ncbi:hypothetical protein LI328DRAFT_76007 [Trichoderma asperelloides]|nr:hypothetical protein LI328DRAFT_76007 [Trichoderma asperelloides]
MQSLSGSQLQLSFGNLHSYRLVPKATRCNPFLSVAQRSTRVYQLQQLLLKRDFLQYSEKWTGSWPCQVSLSHSGHYQFSRNWIVEIDPAQTIVDRKPSKLRRSSKLREKKKYSYQVGVNEHM